MLSDNNMWNLTIKLFKGCFVLSGFYFSMFSLLYYYRVIKKRHLYKPLAPICQQNDTIIFNRTDFNVNIFALII